MNLHLETHFARACNHEFLPFAGLRAGDLYKKTTYYYNSVPLKETQLKTNVFWKKLVLFSYILLYEKQ